jgi:transcriptional regulator
MLYNPPAFKENGLSSLQAQIAASGLTTLVSVGADGPIVSNLPILLDPGAGPYGTIAGHLARANPQWRESDLSKPALALFMGADAYVSPGWYASKREHGKVVPTWNYSMIVARGRLEIFEDAAALRAQVEELTKRFESIEGKAKLSQNRSAADREGVVAALSPSPRAGDREIADAMRARMKGSS